MNTGKRIEQGVGLLALGWPLALLLAVIFNLDSLVKILVFPVATLGASIMLWFLLVTGPVGVFNPNNKTMQWSDKIIWVIMTVCFVAIVAAVYWVGAARPFLEVLRVVPVQTG